jgi:putative acetyltransferase
VTAFEIRRGRPEDARGLVELFAAVAEERDAIATEPPVDIDARATDFAASIDGTIVAVAAGDLVGSLHVEANRFGVGELGMTVARPWRGRGVGSALLAAAIDIADNWLNYRRLELTVYTDNAAAIALYRKFGFVPEGTHRDYSFRDGRFVDALAMARLRPEATGAPRAPAVAKVAAKHPATGRKRPPA